MSDGFAFTDFGSYYAEETKNTDRKTKLLRILVIVLTVVLITEGVLYAVVFPCLAPVKVSVYGLESLSADEIINECGMDMNCGYIGFDVDEFRSRLESVSVIEKVDVKKKFPDQIIVEAKERVPVAFSLVNRDGKSVSVQIDKNGVIFNSTAKGAADSIPLLSGLDIDSTSEGLGIPAMYRPLLEQISEIAEKKSPYFSALSEIHVQPTVSGSYELVLYPIHSHIRVITDRSFDEQKLQYMMVVLDVLDSMDAGVNEVDMRYGTVSYMKQTE